MHLERLPVLLPRVTRTIDSTYLANVSGWQYLNCRLPYHPLPVSGYDTQLRNRDYRKGLSHQSTPLMKHPGATMWLKRILFSKPMSHPYFLHLRNSHAFRSVSFFSTSAAECLVPSSQSLCPRSVHGTHRTLPTTSELT
jgi:hypothetical protein